MARFIQPDSVVPTAATSQALNRYAYVTNNPLKYDDPTGHGNFFKEFIGLIVTVALCFIMPPLFTSLGPFWSTVLTGTVCGAIGSAVSTIVNNGTFASFAIGVGISFAASVAAASIGGYFAGGDNAWSAFVRQGPIEAAMYGALEGSISGDITSAVYGQNIGKGMGEGALGGVTGAGIGYTAGAAISFGGSVLRDFVNLVKVAVDVDLPPKNCASCN